MNSPLSWINLPDDYQIELCCDTLKGHILFGFSSLYPVGFKNGEIIGGAVEKKVYYCPYCGQKFNLKHNPPF